MLLELCDSLQFGHPFNHLPFDLFLNLWLVQMVN